MSPLSLPVELVAVGPLVGSVSKMISFGASVGENVVGCDVVITPLGRCEGIIDVGGCKDATDVGAWEGATDVGMAVVAVTEGVDDKSNVGD